MHFDPPASRPDLPPEDDAAPPPPTGSQPVVARGLVPQALLDPDAVFVVRRLQRAGHEAYLVGGCVRDLLAGLEPKDFDVATDAHPSRIKRLFHSARIIGRRFRLVHVRFPGDHVIETSTFRGDPARIAAEAEANGESLEDLQERHGAENFFGTAPEDARRRDFSINALFYDPVQDEVIDWVGGLADLEGRVVRSIGDPDVRLAEDPVRMIRAVHFAERLGFEVEPTLLQSIERNAARLGEASQARLYVELQKIVSRGRARNTLHRLWELRVLEAWIPELSAFLDRPMAWPEQAGGTHDEARQGEPAGLPAAHATWNLLGAADRWGLAAHGAPESLLMAVLFGPWLLETWHDARRTGHGSDHFPVFAEHVERTFRPVALRMSVPRWVNARLLDVLWMLLELRQPPQPRRRRTFFRPGFSEALALLALDLDARDASDELVQQWTEAALDAGAHVDLARTDQARAETLDQLPPDPRRRRRGGRGRSRAGVGGPEGDLPRRPPPLPAEAEAWEPEGDPERARPGEEAFDPQVADAPTGPRPAPSAWPQPLPPSAPALRAPATPPPVIPAPATPATAARPPAGGPRPAPTRPAAPPAAPPPAPPAAPQPRSPLADDDFAAGIF